jgi:hypothetical protein
MNDSCANVFCRRLGDRSGPVKNGDRIVCVSTRSLLTVPCRTARRATQPVTYDGAAFAPLLNRPAGGGPGFAARTAPARTRQACP